MTSFQAHPQPYGSAATEANQAGPSQAGPNQPGQNQAGQNPAEPGANVLAAGAGGQDGRVAREARVTTILLIGRLVSGGMQTLCRIRNISRGGLMAEVYATLDRGDAISIELRSGERLSGTVRWAGRSRIGIAFDAPVDVSRLLSEAASRGCAEGQTRLPRFDTSATAEIRMNGHRHAATICDLSLGGAHIASSAALEKDMLLIFAVPGLPERRAAVRWVKEGEFGLAFLEPFAFAELGPWLADPTRRYAPAA
ncbi:PilZ domain-containing protein [Sphingobium sp. H39-3-25]|uniref:PilZ domain-containing protein n=1 Tax=Sphingobium arseniciresistens TaxID=3030834 RepID=UPI0023B93716|nr:PilZ domain-containing protein [Sphingobium arseniciresistens]